MAHLPSCYPNNGQTWVASLDRLPSLLQVLLLSPFSFGSLGLHPQTACISWPFEFTDNSQHFLAEDLKTPNSAIEAANTVTMPTPPKKPRHRMSFWNTAYLSLMPLGPGEVLKGGSLHGESTTEGVLCCHVPNSLSQLSRVCHSLPGMQQTVSHTEIHL